MSFHTENLYKALIPAVISCDPEEVRNILDKSEQQSFPCTEVDESLLHIICNLTKWEHSKSNEENCVTPEKEKSIIYMIVDARFDIEQKDKNGNTCLFYAVKNKNAFICDILLQCGADMWAHTELSMSVHDYVIETSSPEIKEVFNKYFPGLWQAVEKENIYQVRKLVNLWCRTDLCKNDVSLKDVALSTGNEEIISLILGICDSMKLVYHIFAKNIKAVSKLLETNHQRIRLDLRKMSDRGAPILYYLIQSKDILAIELFIKHGCQLYTIMQDELGFEMPVFFSVLKAGMPASVAETLLPIGKIHQEELLYKILYRGQTVLEVALEKNVSIEVFNVLIDRGGPLLLCERNQMNQTVRDLALSAGKTQYVDAIDLTILSWILHPMKYPGHRQKFALYGWDLENIQEELKENICIDEYFTYFKQLQVRMKQLSETIENGDMKTFLKLKESLCGEAEHFLWHGRVVGDGMPLLHKAVLFNRLKMVEIILAEKPSKESIDNLFDQNRRTALHYAYADASMIEIKKLLMSYGCSEHVLDKINREPLDFRDKQDTAGMIELLNRLKSKDFNTPEIDPWKDRDTIMKHYLPKSTPCCQHSNMTCKVENEEYPSDCESNSDSELSEEEETQTKSCTII